MVHLSYWSPQQAVQDSVVTESMTCSQDINWDRLSEQVRYSMIRHFINIFKRANTHNEAFSPAWQPPMRNLNFISAPDDFKIHSTVFGTPVIEHVSKLSGLFHFFYKYLSIIT